MVALGALAWAVASAWPSYASDARAGIVLATVAGLGGLLMKSQALRRGIKAALAWTVALFFARVALWGAGVAWLWSRGGNAQAFTAGFCGVFAVGLWLEISYVLAASRRRQRGAA
jgi:hypothetical protein